VLHPAELAWITEKVESPAWFLNAAAAVPAAVDEDDGVLRLLTDDELAQHPDPAAVLQSWLDSPAVDEILSRSEAAWTLTPIWQLPTLPSVPELLDPPAVPLPFLGRLCAVLGDLVQEGVEPAVLFGDLGVLLAARCSRRRGRRRLAFRRCRQGRAEEAVIRWRAPGRLRGAKTLAVRGRRGPRST
jgi:hypothetical protein